MARGWESKAVEAQIETAERGSAGKNNNRFSIAEIKLRQERDGLVLSRSKVLQDLQRARNPRHIRMLEETLRALDEQLAKLVPQG